ncbi:MAG TPA: Spy/CpxP family protein refolding chaperone [Ignavibacteria bacterium]|nr:Spy/CpxP family protein refolding chaperone [Ignavibacteria bacterium]
MDEQIKTPKTKTVFNKFLLIYFISSIAIISIVSAGFAFKVKEFRDHGPFGFIMNKIVKELDLNTEQKAAIDKIQEEVKAKMDENKKERENHMSEFGNLFKQDKLDKDQLMTLSKNHDTKREEMKSFFMDELIKVHSILTPDQRTKAVEKMREFKEKRKEWKKDRN